MLQSLGLLLANLVEQRAHSTSVGEVSFARLVHLLDARPDLGLCLWRHQVFLVFGKDEQYLVELIGRIVVYIEEIVEAALESRVYAEQVVHLRAVASSDDDELAAIVLHPLHEFLQSLCSLVVAVAGLTDGCQRVSLVDEEDAAHRLVAQTVNDFGVSP